jgi:hypothetical protein
MQSFNLKNTEVTTQPKKTAKTIGPGKNTLRITSMELISRIPGSMDPVSWDAKGAYHTIMLHTETPPITEEGFEGFLKDVSNPAGPRYAGQVGRVKLNSVAYRDKDGKPWYMQAMVDIKRLTTTLELNAMVNAIETDSMSDLVYTVGQLVASEKDLYLDMIVAGSAYIKDGYTNYSLNVAWNKGRKGSAYVLTGSDGLFAYDAEADIYKSDRYQEELAAVEASKGEVEAFGDSDSSNDGLTL